MNDQEVIRSIDRALMMRRFALGLAIDVLLVWLAVWYFSSDGESVGLTQVAFGVAAIWALQLVLAFKNFMSGIASAWWLERNLLEKNFLHILRGSKAPVPGNYAERFDYLSDIADDDDADPVDRVKAASIYAAWTTPAPSPVVSQQQRFCSLNKIRPYDCPR